MQRQGVVAVAVAALAGALGAACRQAPDDDRLERLRAEAVAANTEALARAAARDPGAALTIGGQLTRPGATLGWAAVQRLAQTHVRTINPQDPDTHAPTDFRGVLVRDLLDAYGAAPAATEVTAVSEDGFRATLQIADARAYRMLLAVEANGAPIPRSSGGPIFLIHPYSEGGAPLRERYPDRFWAFYVTHLIVGTEPARVRVRGPGAAGPVDAALDAAALDRLPATALDGPVAWKVEWPAEATRVHGVAVADVLAAAGVTMGGGDELVVRGKAPLHRDPARPITLSAAALAACRPVLARAWGPDARPITARLGGPLALALAPCTEASERAWVTFVEELEVRARAAGSPP